MLHTNLKSEQINTLEKVFEHLWFLKFFYDDLKLVFPGMKQEQVVVVSTNPNLTVTPSEDPALFRLLNVDFAHLPRQAATGTGDYTPFYFGENKVLALMTCQEKKCSSAASLKTLIDCCSQDLYDIYPVNYLVPDGIIIIDACGKMLYSNFVAQNICQRLGITGDSFSAMTFSALIEALGITYQVFTDFLLEPAFMSNNMQIGHFDVSIIMNPLFTKGNFDGALIILSDLTLIKKKERELIKKSTVIKEIHHRVKNNLQTITSLLRLQMRRTNSEKVEKAFNESINRILSIALIHEALSHQELEIINIKQTVYKLLEMILANMVAPNKTINGEIRGEDVYLNALQASKLSLCVTELVQNAVEHAFKNQTEGLIRITVEKTGDEVRITVQDNGVGVSPKGFEDVRSLGMKIVDTITQNDLNGKFYIDGSRAGTVACIVFPAGIKEGGEGN